MRIAYLKKRNLDSHKRKAISYWMGGGVSQIMGMPMCGLGCAHRTSSLTEQALTQRSCRIGVAEKTAVSREHNLIDIIVTI